MRAATAYALIPDASIGEGALLVKRSTKFSPGCAASPGWCHNLFNPHELRTPYFHRLKEVVRSFMAFMDNSRESRRAYTRLGPRLPLEVFERMMDFVNTIKVGNDLRVNDKTRRATLHSCALTCRGWVHRARFHLHHSITFHDAVEFHKFVALLHETPAVAGYVCKLATVPPGGNQEWLHLVPVELSSLTLSKLENLFLMHCDWRNPSPMLFAFATKWNSVSTLTLQAVQFNLTRELVRVLFSFTRLNNLSLREVSCAKVKPFNLSKRMAVALPLQSLVFRRSWSAYLLFVHLSSTGSAALVRSVDMDLNLDAPELPDGGRFLSSCGSLETLFITLPMDVTNESKSEYHEHFDFEKVTRLQTLRMEFTFSAANMTLIVHILSTIRSPALDTIFLRLWTSPGEEPLGDMDGFDWGPLDAVLVSKHLPGLFQVCIQTPYRFGSSDLRSRLERYLPLAQKNGLLVSEI